MELNIEEAVAEIRECISNIHVLRDCDERNINEWLLMDTTDPEYNIH